jgi:glutamyl-Q tRNA(Asp) synthetase
MNIANRSHTKPYVGRFAPSPSGPLHFGSLVTALASYLDAKRHNGQWLLRIEDIDPPREQPGAAEAIKRTLEAHGLFWDGEVRYQSDRGEAYQYYINELRKLDLIYECHCTRARLNKLNGPYDGHCRHHKTFHSPSALRLKVTDLPKSFQHISPIIEFIDRVHGHQKENLSQTSGDFIIHRKDGLFAYQMAVVIDDIDQDITNIVRGDDLLDTTARQIFLYYLLGKTPPSFAHIPVILDTHGNKLSKQNHAPALDNSTPLQNLRLALNALNMPCMTDTCITDCLHGAVQAWVLNNTEAN